MAPAEIYQLHDGRHVGAITVRAGLTETVENVKPVKFDVKCAQNDLSAEVSNIDGPMYGPRDYFAITKYTSDTDEIGTEIRPEGEAKSIVIRNNEIVLIKSNLTGEAVQVKHVKPLSSGGIGPIRGGH